MAVKFALVLSGGGFNGAFQIGALKYLSQNWESITGNQSPMKFDIVAGVSAGAINGALVAQGDLEKLSDLWINCIGKNGASEIYTSDFLVSSSDQLKLGFNFQKLANRLISTIDLKLNVFEKLGLIFSKHRRMEVLNEALEYLTQLVQTNFQNFRSIASNAPLREKLNQYLDRSKIRECIFTCGFVSLNSGIYHAVKHSEFLSDENFVDGVLSSTAIPMIWEPVHKVSFRKGSTVCNSLNNVDGGIMNVSPLGDVVNLIADDNCQYKIFIINCHSGIPTYESFTNRSIGAIAARAIHDLSFAEIFNNDVNHFLQINDLVKQAHSNKLSLKDKSGRPLKTFDACIINPRPGFDLGSSLIANETLINRRINHGFEQARLFAQF